MKTKLMQVTLKEREKAARAISAAVKIISEGGIVIFPTETSYGIGVDATNEAAVKAVFELKGRDATRAMPIIVSDLGMAREYADVNAVAEFLCKQFMPGPLTLVVEKKQGMLPEALSPYGVAFRIPSNHFARAITGEFGKPVTATSANRSGEPNIYKVADLLREFDGKVGLIFSTGDLMQVPASTVVDVRQMPPKLVREGPVPFAEITSQLKERVAQLSSGSGNAVA